MHRYRKFLPVLAGGIVSLSFVACGGGTNPTPLPSVAIPSVAIPSGLPSLAIPSIAIPSIAIPSGLPSLALPSIAIPSGALPSIAGSHAAPDLEAVLPNDIAGTPVSKVSFSGETLTTSGVLGPALRALGKQPSDAAAALSGGDTGPVTITMAAIRVNGVSAAALLQALTVAGAAAPSAQSSIGTLTLGGKQVTTVTNGGSSATTTYAYASGDILYTANGTDQTQLGEFFGKLP